MRFVEERNKKLSVVSVPGANRTRNPQLRRLVLYPVELRALEKRHFWFAKLLLFTSQLTL